MSKLFYSDSGRVLKDHNEDLTRWRWVRKDLRLPRPGAGAGADLWILAAAYPEAEQPLQVHLNGRLVGALQPGEPRFRWYRLPVPPGRLRSGINTIILKCDTPAMNAWRPALANGRPGRSYLSFDRGRTWRREQLGVYGVLTGEYVLRLRVHAPTLRDPLPPKILYADPRHPRLKDIRALLPGSVITPRDPWRKLLALRSWTAARWAHDPFGAAYGPWDAPTILDWTAHDRGHGGKGKTAMCVHFSVVLASCAAALGFKARCVALTAGINTGPGHFICEIFDAAARQWVAHDANYDVHYEDEHPLSVMEIQSRLAQGRDLRRMVRAGPGFPKGPRRLLEVFRKSFATGASYRLAGTWPRMDFIVDPSASAVHHGSLVYHEPEWLWQAVPGVDLNAELGMFPLLPFYCRLSSPDRLPLKLSPRGLPQEPRRAGEYRLLSCLKGHPQAQHRSER